jgi:predicted outer membrane repeat protein
MKTNTVNTTTCFEPHTQTRLFVLLLSILCLWGLPIPGLADTYVAGTIAGETWTQANSPYRVIGNIQVALLTINPGVTVLFESNYVFEVSGFLTAIGSAPEPIIFTRTNGAGWQGIFLNNCLDGSELAYCHISGSVNSGIRCLSADAIIRCCVLATNSGSEGGGIYVNNQSYPGSTTLITNCTFTGNTALGFGGAVSVRPGASANGIPIRDCLFSNNSSGNEGGGLYVNSQSYSIGDTVITNCTFSNNTSGNVGGGASLRLGNNKVSFANCTFVQNTVGLNGAGGGAGVFAITSFDGCAFRSNRCINGGGNGGGLYWGGSGTLRNCFFEGNFSGGWSGGATMDGDCLAQNCIFVFNVAPSNRGSGVHLGTGSQTLINCTVAYNSNEGIHADPGAKTVLNSIIFFNASGGTQILGNPTLQYCDVQNGYPAGTNIIAFNPIFADTNTFMLTQPGSRCIDAGNPSSAYNDSCFPPSLGTVRNDLGAYGGPGACCWNSPCSELEIRSQPLATTACVGEQTTFGVGVTGTQPITYQWRFHGTNSAGTPVDIPGATNATYTISNVQSTNAGWYSVEVSNPLGSLDSAAALLTVTPVCVSADLYMGLNITGGVPGQQYNILSTLSLSEPITWAPSATITQTMQGFLWIDTNSPANKPQKYYKVTE